MDNPKVTQHTGWRQTYKKDKAKTNKINKQTYKKETTHTHRANDEQQGPPKNEHRCL